MRQYHLKFLEYFIKKYDAISSKVTGVIDVTRAPKFLGALKVVPKLVASDQKIGRSWMLVKFLNFDLCTSSLCNEIIISSYTWKVEWLDLRGSNPVTTLSMHSNMESKQWYMKLSTIKNDTTNTKANKPIVRMGSIFLLTLSSTISAYLYNYLGCPKSGARFYVSAPKWP